MHATAHYKPRRQLFFAEKAVLTQTLPLLLPFLIFYSKEDSQLLLRRQPH